MRALIRLVFRRRRVPVRPAAVLVVVLTGAIPCAPFDLVIPESMIRRAYADRA